MAALEELDQWRRDFISAVSHDLQNPVIAIEGFAQMVLEDLSATDKAPREFIERILSNTRSLEMLIEHLRAYTQLEADRITLEREPIVVDDFVGNLLADMSPLIDNHRVETDIQPVTVHADRRGLERILRNLVANAARHTPPTADASGSRPG